MYLYLHVCVNVCAAEFSVYGFSPVYFCLNVEVSENQPSFWRKFTKRKYCILNETRDARIIHATPMQIYSRVIFIRSLLYFPPEYVHTQVYVWMCSCDFFFSFPFFRMKFHFAFLYLFIYFLLLLVEKDKSDTYPKIYNIWKIYGIVASLLAHTKHILGIIN